MKHLSSSFLFGLVCGILVTILVMGGLALAMVHERFDHRWGGRGCMGENGARPAYTSSIKVDDTKDISDAENCAVIAPLVKITAAQAEKAAQSAQNGKVQSTILENDGGNVVYSIILGSSGKEFEVKVDAGNAKVLQTSPLQDEEKEGTSEK